MTFFRCVGLVALCAVGLSGCGSEWREAGKKPHLTPVGSGITPSVSRIPVSLAKVERRDQDGSLWRDRAADMYRDPRARRVGDVVTVKISIQDRATLDNSSDRSRAQSRGVDVGLNYDIAVPIIAGTGSGSGDLGVNSDTTFTGQGKTERSENIELELAVVVTGVMPNGNLIISGSQEIRVNYEVRVLRISGIVRRGDISADNRISYDKIAEARVSYGGRGRLMEVQQPHVGHQLLDHAIPF